MLKNKKEHKLVMSKKIIGIGLVIVIALFLILLNKPPLTDHITTSPDSLENEMKLGYCPTVKEEAIALSKEKNYELMELNSASEVLALLNKKEIDAVLIGRKAVQFEITEEVKETIIKPGHTLISKEKAIIDYSNLQGIEIHTYLTKETAESIIPEYAQIIYHSTKEEAISKTLEEEVVLISWDDWKDDFGLLVVMNKNEKVKDFRGVFLYEN